MRHYPYDKMVCGLVDMRLYAGHSAAAPVLEKITAWAGKTFDRANHLADPSHKCTTTAIRRNGTRSRESLRAYS